MFINIWFNYFSKRSPSCNVPDTAAFLLSHVPGVWMHQGKSMQVLEGEDHNQVIKLRLLYLLAFS